MNRKKLISIGIPCFNEDLNVAKAYEELKKITKIKNNYTYEYIFVDNGSTDSTRDEIKKLTKKDKAVIGVFLSRNFGPEASCQATIDMANGEAMIGYECDMQDPPEVILEFIKKWEDGYDLVIGVRTKTEDNILMSTARKIFYRIFKKISNITIPVDAGGFSLMDRKAIDALKLLPEKYRFYRGLRAWIGFKTTYVRYKRRKRKYGKSSYNFFDYMNYAIRSFIGFSYLPLDLAIYTGTFLVLISFIFISTYIFKFLIYGMPINGSVAVIFLIIFFGGSQLLAISMIGKYIQVIIEETKNRPMYIIEKIINNANKK